MTAKADGRRMAETEGLGAKPDQRGDAEGGIRPTSTTSQHTDLISRLSERDASWQKQCDGWNASAHEAEIEIDAATEASMRYNLHAEAAQALSDLTTQRDRLREALEDLASIDMAWVAAQGGLDPAMEAVIARAQAALTTEAQ